MDPRPEVPEMAAPVPNLRFRPDLTCNALEAVGEEGVEVQRVDLLHGEQAPAPSPGCSGDT